MYVRRYRMEFDLVESGLPQPVLPDGYRWVAWQPALIDRHAGVKYWSFHTEIDARVFPCLSDFVGCQRLMYEISRQRTFLPGATWLIRYAPEVDCELAGDCGTIQGLAQSDSLGAIQNVGVVAEHRGLGLGKALVLKALHGFRASGLKRVYLEVTGENVPAVELYRSLGFLLVRTMYKSVATEAAASF